MFGIDDLLEGGASALLGVGGNLLGGILGNLAASDRMDAANTFSAQQYATRYQTTVKDMEAAGLNPMLAYSGISGSPPSGAMSSAQSYGDLGDAYLRSKLNSAQTANVEADTENKKASADLIAAQAANQWSSAGLNNAQIEQVNSNVSKIGAEIEKIKADTAKVKGDTNYNVQQDILRQTAWSLQQQGVANQERGMTEGQSRAVMQQTIYKLMQEGKLVALDVKAAEALDNIGRGAKELMPAIQVLKAILQRH